MFTAFDKKPLESALARVSERREMSLHYMSDLRSPSSFSRGILLPFGVILK